jgi:hypothetical protein
MLMVVVVVLLIALVALPLRHSITIDLLTIELACVNVWSDGA